MNLSIIIPCYNEELSIRKLVNNCIANISDGIEILLVDNGSIDDSYKTLMNLDLPKNIIPLKIEENVGYGNGILMGLKKAKGKILAWTHADLQTDISDVIRGYNTYMNDLNDKICVVKGQRQKRNLFDAFFTFSNGYLFLYYFKNLAIRYKCPTKMFHRKFLNEFVNPPLDFSLDLYLIYFFKSKGIKVKSFPVYFKKKDNMEKPRRNL